MTPTIGKRALGTLAILLGLLAVSGVTAHASSGYLRSFNTLYGTSATRLNSCTLCHPSVPALNAYGDAYVISNYSFPAIEGADSDGDGSTNIVEIRALTFPGDAADKPAPATGTPALTLSPTADAFGNVTIGLSSAPIVNTLTNSGTSALSVTGMTLSNTADYALNLSGGTAPCGATATTLASGASCTLAVTFSPKTAGSRPGTLTVASNDPAGADIVSLSGTGVAAAVPKISVTPATGSFGSIAVGTTSAPIVSTITNTGTAVLSVSAITASNPTDFTLDLNGGSTPCGTPPKTVAAGANCTVSCNFNARTAGARTGTLTIASNDPAAPTTVIPLSGTGVAAATPTISAAPVSLAAGSVTVGASSAPQTVTVSNTGTGNLTIGVLSTGGANGTEFGIQSDRCSSQTLVPAATCTVQVVFNPATAAAKTAYLAIPSNDLATPNFGVTITGTGVTQTNTAPTIVSTTPAANASNIPVNATVSAAFSETMAASSVTTSTFTLSANGVPLTGAVSLSGTTATFTPAAPLAVGTLHTATVTTGATDLGGAGLAAARVWAFTTVSAPIDNTDSDGDGNDDEDDDYPNDNKKATPRPHHGKGKIKIDISSVLGGYLTEVRTMSENGYEGRPVGYRFDDGLVSFKINRGTGTPMITLTFSEAVPAGSKVFMVTQGEYREIPGIIISGNTVTIPVRTGRSDDGDSSSRALSMGGTDTATANIVGVGSPDAAAPAASSGGGCSATGGSAGDIGLLAGLAIPALAMLILRRTRKNRG